MLFDAIILAFCLTVILLSCFVFTNAIEWFGKKLNLGEGVVGSIFAAVGTALPETVIPIIAILYYNNEEAKQVGIGAIAGAPFMLGTLAFFVTGAAVIIYSLMGKRKIRMNADTKVISRDLSFFLAIYGIAVATTFFHQFIIIKTIIAICLLFSYIIYLKRTFSDECEQCENLDPLYASRFFKVKNSFLWIILQLLVALAGILLGAHSFVKYVEDMAGHLGIMPLILSIIITPIATELPEKLNSIIWTGRKKDTLALGNISGAMVFQSCFPVVFGMIFTPWNLRGITLISAIIALGAASINLIWIKVRKTINPFVLLFGGVLYVTFLVITFSTK